MNVNNIIYFKVCFFIYISNWVTVFLLFSFFKVINVNRCDMLEDLFDYRVFLSVVKVTSPVYATEQVYTG